MRNLLRYAIAALVLSVAAVGVASAADETPDAFVKRYFGKYRDMDHWPQGYDICKDYCDPVFDKLLNASNNTGGDLGDDDLDYDPICQCQDIPDKFPVKSVKPDGTDGADVAITRDEDKAAWTLVLRKQGGTWKIFDVVEKDGRSIRAFLTKKFGKKIHP